MAYRSIFFITFTYSIGKVRWNTQYWPCYMTQINLTRKGSLLIPFFSTPIKYKGKGVSWFLLCLTDQGSKLAVANVQNATDLRLFAPKLFYLGATLLLKFLKLILAWRSKSLISFLVVNLCLKGFSLEAWKNTLFEERSMGLWTIWQNVMTYILTYVTYLL